MTAARRLAAILAVDVAGYLRLMGEDEAGAVLAVRDWREAAAPIVGGFDGRLVKTAGTARWWGLSVIAAVDNLGDVLIEGHDSRQGL
jgi:class 3 adenylate cyclase